MRNITVLPRIEHQHVADIAAIDRACFDRSPTQKEITRALRHPHLFTLIIHQRQKETVVGYGFVIPLNRTAHEALKQGRMHEEEIEDRHIASPRQASGLYIASIASLPYYSLLSKMRMASLRGRLVGYTLGPLLRIPKEVFAITVSHEGDSLCREIGMNAQPYEGPLQGIHQYTPRLFTKNTRAEP